MDPDFKIMNVDEVSTWLRIPPSTIYALCRQGKIPCIKIGKHWRFKQKHLEIWLNHNMGDPFLNKGLIKSRMVNR